MDKKICVFDIGGSGVKHALFTQGGIPFQPLQMNGRVEHLPDPDWQNFETWIHKKLKMEVTKVGISCAGFVDFRTGVIKMFRIAGWVNRPLKTNLETQFKHINVKILNDGEAHLMAHTDLYPHPQICLSLGTSVGFGLTSEDGTLRRPLMNSNFDIGEVAIPTRATNNRVWWALGSHGLRELQENLGQEEGIRHFGYRLGAFLSSLAGIFQPKTIVLSGGITELYWDEFKSSLQSEFSQSKPDWLEEPQIKSSPYGKNAALWGMAKYW